MLPRWTRHLLPPATHTRPKEWTRAALGVSLGTLLSVWLCSTVFGLDVALHLIGPLGATAVLLFAVSSGALAQPWPVLGSYFTATVVSLLIVQWLGRSLDTACLAVGLALLAMFLLRCLHPPAGALALTLVLADPATVALGWQEMAPVMLGAMTLLLIAIAYNNLTRVRYPKRHVEPVSTFVEDHRPGEPAGMTTVDLQRALADMDAFIDVTAEDLEELIRATERHARRRSVTEVMNSRR